MKPYIVALAVGMVVGLLYGALNVRSPAPPIVALLGLLGMLLGEQIVPIVKQVGSGQGATPSTVAAGCAEHMFGSLPGRPKVLPPRCTDIAGGPTGPDCVSLTDDRRPTL